METKQVNIAIIGAGTAGLNARKEAEAAGKSWVMIEGGPYGPRAHELVACPPSC